MKKSVLCRYRKITLHYLFSSKYDNGKVLLCLLKIRNVLGRNFLRRMSNGRFFCM